jgi:hypothetical protein
MKHGARGILPAVWPALAILVILSVSTPTVAETRACATATLDEPFVMPGGTEHAPGKLTLCRGLEYSPTRTMYVSYVDRASVGMLFGERGRSEAPTDNEPYMMFARDRKGRLHLYGFAVPCREGMETFMFGGFPAGLAVASTKASVRSETVDPTT